MTSGAWRQSTRRVAMHWMRAGFLVAIVLLIHWEHHRVSAARQAQPQTPIDIEQLQNFYPSATGLRDTGPREGGHEVVNAAGGTLGYVLQTSPEGDKHIGFSGPTNVLLAFGKDDKLRGISIISSRDTREHVAQVRESAKFMHALDGLTWEEASRKTDVDAVTGATLTSLAMLEAIGERLGGERPSLRFPDPLTIAEAQRLFADAAFIERDAQHVPLWHINDAQRKPLGTILRTSPAADNLVGYQGPTEAIISFDTSGKVIGISLRKSYDNEEYVTYVRDDEYFLTLFNDLMLGDLATLDFDEHGVEGVSGATMTSMNVAEGLRVAAADHQASLAKPAPVAKRTIGWTLRDAGTAAVVVLGLIIGLTRLRANKYLRIGFQLLLIGYLGLINGDMLSQAMLVGWSQSGIPWRSAGGLVVLSAAALAVPLLTRHNVYCTHICPHGAAQQLLRNRLRWQWHISPLYTRWLKMIPGVLLAWCLAVAMLHLPFSLVDIEPFDAWVWRIAGWATIAIAVVGLVASLFVPMAYCRYGCPTGALLEFLRFNSRSDRWSPRDWLALVLLLSAAMIWTLSTSIH